VSFADSIQFAWLTGPVRSRFLRVFQFIVVVLALLAPGVGAAQQPPPQLGDAYATRFSGMVDVADAGGTTRKVIDLDGVVGSLIGLANPAVPPAGHHWRYEPQRLPVTARQVGQVFGIALDDASPPNIYLTATAAFGLHRTPDNAAWMEGMWGEGGAGSVWSWLPGLGAPRGDPGTVWILSGANDYQPRVFAQITLDGRANTGAALGNIAYDGANKQLFVSDLETGMIHRLRLSDGADLGRFDHGTTARANFFDVATGQAAALAPVPFDPASAARIDDCPGGDFSATPACWNAADFRRRVWGIGLYRSPASGQLRLYYAIWGSQGFVHPDWAAAGDDQRSAVWSVAIAADGAFDAADVRREFFVPGFFSELADFERAGGSHPVSDIAFSEAGTMLLAERGGLRNLGLGADDAFAWPHESRVLRYQLGEDGTWALVGRNDVGFYERQNHGPPFLRAGSAGGVDFGFGYTERWQIDVDQPDQFVWITGDALCSPEAACFNLDTNLQDDADQVHGLQGAPAGIVADVAPDAVFQAAFPQPGPATPPTGPQNAYMIDTDQNVDADGVLIAHERTKDDATKGGGDVEVFRTAAAPPPPVHAPPGSIHLPVGSRPGQAPPVYVPPIVVHSPPGSIHWPPGSTHWPLGSAGHWPPGSAHWPEGSGHWPQGSGHWPPGSAAHWPPGSVHKGKPSIHWPPGSIIHKGKPSLHWPPGSVVHKGAPSIHVPIGSVVHKGKPSIHWPPGSAVVHKGKPSLHWPVGSVVHKAPLSPHFPAGSKHLGTPSIHWPLGSVAHKGGPSVHTPPGSIVHKAPLSPHFPAGSKHIGTPSVHLPAGSVVHKGVPSVHIPLGSTPGHKPVGSLHSPPGSIVHKGTPSLHTPPGSQHLGTPSIHVPLGSAVHKGTPSIHLPAGSVVHKGKPSLHSPPGSAVVHTLAKSKLRPIHSTAASRTVTPVHDLAKSKAATPPVHDLAKSKAVTVPAHSAAKSKAATVPVHDLARSKAATVPAHSTAKSKAATTPVHSAAASKAATTPAHSTAKSKAATVPAHSTAASKARTVHSIAKSKAATTPQIRTPVQPQIIERLPSTKEP